MNNLHIGPDAGARFLLQSLKNHQGNGEISGVDTHVMEGVFFSLDPDARITGTYATRPDEMVSFRLRPEKSTPRWQALRLNLGALDLSHSMVLGLAIKSRAPVSTTTRLCLRAGLNGEFVDTTMPKTLVSFADSSVHLDALELDKAPGLPRQPDWLDLIFFFRNAEVAMDLQDIRLFVL